MFRHTQKQRSRAQRTARCLIKLVIPVAALSVAIAALLEELTGHLPQLSYFDAVVNLDVGDWLALTGICAGVIVTAVLYLVDDKIKQDELLSAQESMKPEIEIRMDSSEIGCTIDIHNTGSQTLRNLTYFDKPLTPYLVVQRSFRFLITDDQICDYEADSFDRVVYEYGASRNSSIPTWIALFAYTGPNYLWQIDIDIDIKEGPHSIRIQPGNFEWAI